MKLLTARGVEDIEPEQKIVKNKIVLTLQQIFELYGFSPLETPIVERYETLTAKFTAGTTSDILKEIFKLNDQGKRKLGLRFDLTVPLARYIAMNPNLKMPFKRYEIGNVFRDGPIKAGRTRQFWQCDVDIIGSNSILAEAEILTLAQKVFNKLKLDIIIKVNNRKLLNGILDQIGIKKKEEVLISIDKLEKIGKKEVKLELKEKKLTEKQIEELFSLLNPEFKFVDLNKKLKNKEALTGLEELEQLFKYLKILKVKAKFDISLARGLGYYTGIVYEIFMRKSKVSSSLAAGGRWGNMIGNFLGNNKNISAVGISFGLVPILEVFKEKIKTKQKTLTQVYLIPLGTLDYSLKIIEELREYKINSEIDLNNKGMSKNLQYANTLGIPYVLIIGENELKKNKILLKNMDSGEQLLLSLKEIVKKLKN